MNDQIPDDERLPVGAKLHKTGMRHTHYVVGYISDEKVDLVVLRRWFPRRKKWDIVTLTTDAFSRQRRMNLYYQGALRTSDE